LQKTLDPKRLVFIDETWVKTNMVRLRGRAPRGQRLREKVPHGHWNTMTFIGALRSDRIDAPWVLDQPVNGKNFLLYVKQCVVPTLQKGDMVMMDNLKSHKNREIRRAIRAAGAKLWFLPSYSPDLNPIEQAFAKLKELLRKAAERSFEDVCDRIGALLAEFSPKECANYLRNAGYVAAPTPDPAASTWSDNALTGAILRHARVSTPHNRSLSECEHCDQLVRRAEFAWLDIEWRERAEHLEFFERIKQRLDFGAGKRCDQRLVDLLHRNGVHPKGLIKRLGHAVFEIAEEGLYGR